MSRSAVATLVERRSRLLRLVQLPEGHGSKQLVTALTAALTTINADRLLTLTWDQGSEMACHDKVATLFREGVFFADPARGQDAAGDDKAMARRGGASGGLPPSSRHNTLPEQHN